MELSGNITLVVFTSEGREHLLKQTLPSFKNACTVEFSETILSIDGKYNANEIELLGFDHLLHHPKRIGYVNSIMAALKLISTPFFFLLEDDFIFKQPVPIVEMFKALSSDINWAAVFLSRSAPLTPADRLQHICDSFYRPEYGLSVSPALFNTTHLKDAFVALKNEPKNEQTAYMGFEPYIDEYFVKQGIQYAVIDPFDTPHVDHIGYFESTAREYHMINSIDKNRTDVNKRYLSGFGKELKLTTYNKLAMLPKLWVATLSLTFRLFIERRAYDTAFRLYISFLRKFKY